MFFLIGFLIVVAVFWRGIDVKNELIFLVIRFFFFVCVFLYRIVNQSAIMRGEKESVVEPVLCSWMQILSKNADEILI